MRADNCRRLKIWPVNLKKARPGGFGCCPFYGADSSDVYSLFVVAPICIIGFTVRSVLCFAVRCIFSSFTIISLWKRDLVALLLLCSECHAMSLLSFLVGL